MLTALDLYGFAMDAVDYATQTASNYLGFTETEGLPSNIDMPRNNDQQIQLPAVVVAAHESMVQVANVIGSVALLAIYQIELEITV